MKNNKIAVIGSGVMGSIIIRLFKKLNYEVIGLDKGDDISKAESCGTVVISVKPQDFHTLDLKLNKDTLVISIMAGTTVATIKKHLKVTKVIRSMPNMPAQIEKGFVGWFATKQVTIEEKNLANKLWRAMGESLEVKSEDTINKITAISGSGPAYVFYILNAFILGAKSLGIKDAEARRMAIQTMKGSLDMITDSIDLSVLIKNVASKGGTTEAGLFELNKGKVNKTFEKTIKSAYNRALKLSK